MGNSTSRFKRVKTVIGMSPDEQRPLVLKRLRRKFIAINMAMAVLVLGCTFGIVSYLDYTTRVDNVYSELQYVMSEALSPPAEQLTSTQPLMHRYQSAARAEGTAASAASASTTTSTTSPSRSSTTSAKNTSQMSVIGHDAGSASETPPTIGTTTNSKNSVILIAVYNVNPAGSYSVVSDYTNASIPEQIVVRANDIVTHNADSQGYLEEYGLYFLREVAPDNPDNFLVAYADDSSVNGWRLLTLTLGLVGLAALAVFFLINIYFSKWALRPVELSIKQQQQFTADASHELKTPLTVIIANMAILKSEPEENIGSQMQWIESTQTEAERMQLLVNDMLALSRPETHKQQMAQEPVDFSDIVEGEILQFESVAFELGVELESEIEEGLFVKGDAERLGRMVAILVDNACKYASKPTEDDASVDVTLARKSSASVLAPTLELKVHNTGPAIPEEDLPHVFTRFYRADKVRTGSKGGYGLGLAIGQEIAGEHGGEISVTSTEQAGTTFTVTLPLMPHDAL